MNRSIEWIKAHPLASFFSLTLVLTFVLLFPALYFLDRTDQDLVVIFALYMARLGVYVPVLVGMLVTRWILPDQSPTSATKRWSLFGIVWLVALIVSALDLQRGGTPLEFVPLLILSIPIAVLPAFVVSSAFSRIASLREYLSTLIRPRGALIYYLIALLTFPVLYILGLAITQLLTGEPRLSSVQLSPEILVATLITFASVFFYSGGINEESGWRGFAQRRLQTKHSPLIANVLLWAYLVILHIPNDIVQYRDGDYLLVRFGLYPFITILFGWVYNRTRGSILAPALFHASMNSMNTLKAAIPGSIAMSVLLVLFAVFAVVLDRMWKKLPAHQPAVYPVDDAA